MRKFSDFRSRVNAHFHRSRSFRFCWHTFNFCFSLSTGFYLAIRFKSYLINLINRIDDTSTANTLADWCEFGIVTIIASLIVCVFVLLGAYAQSRLIEILNEFFAYKEIESDKENPLSLWERGRDEGTAEAAELHIETKAIKRKVKRFRSCGASYFSLLVQRKVTKRKHTLPPRPAR